MFSISEDSFQLSRYTTFSKLDGIVWTLPEWLSGRDFIQKKTDEHCICYLSFCRDERASGIEFLWAPFEGVQHVIAWLGHEVAGHIVSAIRNQRTAKAVKLIYSFPFFSLGPQAMGQRCPNTGWVFCTQLNISGNSLTGRPRDVSSRLL